MEIDFKSLEPAQRYALMIRAITPRPIAWISTVNSAGQANLAPFSFFAGVGSDPPALVVSFVNKPDGSPKDTLRNIEETQEFVVNAVSYDLRQSMFDSSDELPCGESEIEALGIETVPAKTVRPPRLTRAPLQFECQLHQIVRIGASSSVFGIIQWVHIDDRVLSDGKIDPELLDTIGRMGGRSYCRTTQRFELS